MMNYQEKSKDELIKYILKLEQDLISFKKSAEEELKKEKEKLKALSLSEENFQLLFNKAPLGYQSLDFDGNFIDVNQQWFDTLGYQREEVIGKWFGDFLTPAYRDGFRKRFPLFKAQGHIHSEFEMIHKNGSHLFIAFDGRIGYNSKGEFKQTHCILQDITEKKRAENALRESEEKYRLLHENAGIGIGYYKLDGTIISYNNIAAKNMNGLAEDFSGKSIYDIFPEQNARFYHERIKKAAVSEIPEVYEDEVSLPTTKKYFLSTFTRIINLNGEIDGIQILSQDITDRKNAENENLKTGQYYQALIEKAPDGIVLLDAEGNFKYISPSAKKMFGYNQTDEISGHPNEYTHPDDLQMVLFELGKIFEDPTYIPTIEYRFIDKLGHWHWIETTFSNLLANPSVESIVLNFRDISERKENEEKLIKSEERYALVIEASEQGIWDWNVETNEVFYSAQWKNQIGYKDDELKNEFSTWVEHLHPDESEYCQNAVISYLNQATEHFILNFRLRHKDGSYRWIHNKAASLKNEDGKVVRLFGTHTDITDSKLSEAIFKDIIDKNPMSIQILDMEGYVIQTNPAHTKLFGISPPKDYSVFKDVQLLNQGFGELFEQIKKGEVVYFPDSYFNVGDIDPSFPDFPVWVKAIGFALNDNNGNPNRIILMHENITERKHAEAFLNDIIEKNPMSIQIVDREGHTLRYNRAFIELFGSVPPPEFSIFDDLINKSAELERLVLKVKDGEIVHLPDIYFNAHDEVSEAPDIPLWIRALIFPLKDSGGKPERFVFMHENITERKIAENNLKESELKYRSLIESSSDAIFCVDKTGKYVFTNQLFASTFNKTPEYFIGKTFWDVYDKEHADYRFEASSRLFRTGLSETIEVDVPLKDQTLYFLATTNPIKDEKGNVILNLTHATDITRLKIVEKELQKAKEKAEENDRLKSAFLANMSHEIRTPMNGILGFAELLKEPELTGEQQQKYVKIIEKSGSRMLNIINDIIDISKIEAGLMKVDLKESNVNEQIEYIYTFFKPEVENKGMQLIINNKLKADEAIVYTDREKLYAIFTNLVKNAVKYSYNGFIEIGCSLSDTPINTNGLQNIKVNSIAMTSNGKELQFYVKDSGIGISKDRHQAIFERFVQADIDDKMARQGAGLGLAITKSYVEMLGGKIWLESDEGAGSCFYFTLPFNAKTAEKTVSEESSATINNYAYNLKILIAEDDETSEILLSIFAETYCREIIKVKNGKEAIETCRRIADIDLILMDIQMPEIGGYEATKQIRKFNKNVVIIAQTAFGLYGDKEKAIEAGCNDYLSKPIDKKEFENLIYKYFDNKCSLK